MPSILHNTFPYPATVIFAISVARRRGLDRRRRISAVVLPLMFAIGSIFDARNTRFRGNGTSDVARYLPVGCLCRSPGDCNTFFISSTGGYNFTPIATNCLQWQSRNNIDIKQKLRGRERKEKFIYFYIFFSFRSF